MLIRGATVTAKNERGEREIVNMRVRLSVEELLFVGTVLTKVENVKFASCFKVITQAFL